MSDPTQEPSLLQNVVTALVVVLGTIGGFVSGRQRRPAAEAAEVAGLTAEAVKSRAESVLYQQLIDRVETLEARTETLEQQLETERALRRAWEDHVALLEGLMREAGLNPPAFEPFKVRSDAR